MVFLRDSFLLLYFIRTDVYQLKCLFNLSYYLFINLVLNVQDDVLCKICLVDCPLSHMVKIEGCGCTFCKEVSQLIQLPVPVVGISAGDPDLDPQDPHVFGPPGSGSVSQESDVPIRILPFSHKGVERTEIMLAK
jgi:hypothetical protein